MDNKNETKVKIIDTTVELLKEGIDNLTVRKITDSAGVNVSAVNYHFGSLYNLLALSGEKIFSEIRGLFDILEDLDKTPEDRLKKFIISYSFYVKKYKKMILHALDKGLLPTSAHESYFLFLKQKGFEKIKNVLREITGKDENLDIFVLQSFIGMLFPYVVFSDFNLPLTFDVNDLEKQIDVFLSFIKNK